MIGWKLINYLFRALSQRGRRNHHIAIVQVIRAKSNWLSYEQMYHRSEN